MTTVSEISTPPVEFEGDVNRELEIVLRIDDADLCDDLEAYPNGRERHDYAVGALKIGALALRHARGRVDSDRVRVEGERLLTALNDALVRHQSTLGLQLTGILGEYFDPQSGRLPERIERLTKSDGELEQLLRRHVGGNDSELARTLASQIGENSALVRLLNPSASDGFVSGLRSSIELELSQQRERILREFSLDNKAGALNRLLEELVDHHGQIGKALEERVDRVVAEFSLDREESALSRLVGRVERAQRQISDEFSLDQEGSALARLRRELLELAEVQRANNSVFQRDVLTKLTEITARREEALRSTRHGEDFESAVFDVIQSRSQKAGDVATQTGATTGLLKHCKRGDIVIQLGPEHTAAGAVIVVEAKEDASYTVQGALEDLELARKNRGASVGLFVFSARTAPAGLEPFSRYSDDVVIVWDADDPQSDVVLIAGISVAKGLCARARAVIESRAADFEAIDRAVLEIERQIGGLDEISKYAGTIKASGEKIIDRVRIMGEAARKQLTELSAQITDLKSMSAGLPHTTFGQN
jgi:hypothetical protein